MAELAREWTAPVYVNELEMPFVTGQRSYPPPNPSAGGGVMSILSPSMPTSPINISGTVKALPPYGVVPGLLSWRWIHTPGHRDGHVFYFRERDRTLVAGDASPPLSRNRFGRFCARSP